MHRLLRLALGLSVAVSAQPLAAQRSEAEILDIIRVQDGQAAAWNAHDAHAYALLFTKTADVVNVLGWHWRGRAELETKLASAFAFVFARSSLKIENVKVRFISNDIAVAHVRWSMTGALSPDGLGGNVPQRGIQTQLLKRRGNAWLIDAFQNTNEVPERPFPVAESKGD